VGPRDESGIHVGFAYKTGEILNLIHAARFGRLQKHDQEVAHCTGGSKPVMQLFRARPGAAEALFTFHKGSQSRLGNSQETIGQAEIAWDLRLHRIPYAGLRERQGEVGVGIEVVDRPAIRALKETAYTHIPVENRRAEAADPLQAATRSIAQT
jgi:hypothetical protein